MSINFQNSWVKPSLEMNSGLLANLISLSSLISQSLGKDRLILGDAGITIAASFPTTENPIIKN
ncbi:MAG: hypothetical protein M1113_04700 [Candidatus Thermoplasmatota archaeon]|nr:hypothetical protein [Candidatus Thermoplasmatota archaeon]